MSRPRRQIYSRQVYEICMRTARGLPFVCNKTLKTIMKSVMARVQRDEKVELCHFVWMGNHAHIIVVVNDSAQCVRFYGELQKQLTDSLKRLLGFKHLNLWKKNGTSLIRYCDVDTIVERIAYLYANPSRAHLIDCIERYPGLSSWGAYREALSSVLAQHSSPVPWIRAPFITKLPSRALTEAQDRAYVEKLCEQAKKQHALTLCPNGWLKVFGIEEEREIEQINTRIVERLREFEREAREERARKGWKVKGARRLQEEAIDLKHTPKGDSIRIYVYSIVKEIRIAMLEEYTEFCRACSHCYDRWKMGDFSVNWPPGALLPNVPLTTNYFDC